MPISITCTCGRSLRAKDELAGRRVRCPGCNTPLLVPQPANNTEDEIIELGADAIMATPSPRAVTPGLPPQLPAQPRTITPALSAQPRAAMPPLPPRLPSQQAHVTPQPVVPPQLPRGSAVPPYPSAQAISGSAPPRTQRPPTPANLSDDTHRRGPPPSDEETPPPRRKRKKVKSRTQSRGSGGIAVHPSILAGVAMMLGAVVWFVVGLAAGRIFFYPPILFVLGIGAIIRGFKGSE